MPVRPLPFQFQQRGVNRAKPMQQDAKKTARFTEQRDQDLENYLANLGSSSGSAALWNLPAMVLAPNVVQNITPTSVTTLGNFSGSVGSVVFNGDAMSVVCVYFAYVILDADGSCVPGFASCSLSAIGYNSSPIVVGPHAVGFGSYGTTTLLDVGAHLVAVPLTVFDGGGMSVGFGGHDLDIVTNTGTLGTPDIINVTGGVAGIYVVS